MPPNLTKTIHFGSFVVTPQVFHTTTLSFALVNLKPLLPGHVLISPQRVVSRFADLTPQEVTDLFATVQKVSKMVSRVYKADALNIAIQDGKAAGQSVPHVHAHVIPRHDKDLDSRGGSDAIYPMMESEEGDVGEALRRRDAQNQSFVAKPDDSQEREARSLEVMQEEADWLAKEMDREE